MADRIPVVLSGRIVEKGTLGAVDELLYPLPELVTIQALRYDVSREVDNNFLRSGYLE